MRTTLRCPSFDREGVHHDEKLIPLLNYRIHITIHVILQPHHYSARLFSTLGIPNQRRVGPWSARVFTSCTLFSPAHPQAAVVRRTYSLYASGRRDLLRLDVTTANSTLKAVVTVGGAAPSAAGRKRTKVNGAKDDFSSAG